MNLNNSWTAGVVLTIAGATGTYFGVSHLLSEREPEQTFVSTKYFDMLSEVESIDDKLNYLLSEDGMKDYYDNLPDYAKKIDSLTYKKMGVVSSKEYVKEKKFVATEAKNESSPGTDFLVIFGLTLAMVSCAYGCAILLSKSS